MSRFPATVGKRWGFGYDAAVLLALGLCSAFAVARHEVHARELAPPTASLFYAEGRAAGGPAGLRDERFVVSDALIAMLLNEPGLGLTAGGYVTDKSSGAPAAAESERLVQQFLALLNQTAAGEYGAAPPQAVGR